MGSRRSRRRRQGLQAQGLDHRIGHKERDRLGKQVSGSQELLHDQVKKRSRSHKVHDGHKVIGHDRKRLKVIHDLSLKGAETERRTGCQVILDRHPYRSQLYRIGRDKDVRQPSFHRLDCL